MVVDQYGVYQDTDGTYKLEDGTALIEYNADNGQYVEESDPTTLYNADGSVADNDYAAEDAGSGGGGGFWAGTNFNTVFTGLVTLASGYMAMKSGKTTVKSTTKTNLPNGGVAKVDTTTSKKITTLGWIGIIAGTGLLVTLIVVVAKKKG